MEGKKRSSWAWLLAVVLLLAVALAPDFSSLGLNTSAALGSDLPAVAAAPARAALDAQGGANTLADKTLDEEQAASALEERMIGVYDLASDAVVNITNRSYVYYRFMGAVPEEGTGSGFVYDTEGHIVTNYHVIADANELLVTLSDGQVFDATVVGSDPANDLAVIQIDAGSALPAPLAIGDSDALRVGQFVVAIGNPYGLEQTMTTGVVSALGRVIEGAEDGSFIGEAIQTDAAINPGNSGGPLLDLQGEVIGVNSQIISTSGSSAGIGFAVSANTVQRVVPELIARGYYAHPWLGVDTVDLTASIAGMLREAGVDVAADAGLLVLDVTRGGPADKAGLTGGDRWVRFGRYQLPVGGDIITAVDGRPVTELETLTVYLEMEKAIGEVVELTVLRGDQVLTIPVTIGQESQL